MDLLRLAILILFAAPGFAAHTGVTRRNGFSLSDAAIFGIVVAGYGWRSVRCAAATASPTTAARIDTPRHEREAAAMAFTDPLDALEAVIRSRRGTDPTASYTASLFAKGRPKIAQKLGEEAVEAVIAAVRGDRAELVGEAADVLFHLLVVLVDAGLTLDDVRAELAKRDGVSGLVEKASRPKAAAVVEPVAKSVAVPVAEPSVAPIADGPAPLLRPMGSAVEEGHLPVKQRGDDGQAHPLPLPLAGGGK